MAPDRGSAPLENERGGHGEETDDHALGRSRSGARKYLAEQASQPQNFTLRGVLVGLAIGVVICFSNMYFGLQTGWVSGMAMPSALIGFAYFNANLQAQLGEAISAIADSDFWQRWDTLVDDLISRLTPDNTVVNNGVLQVAHSIFKRWRPLFRSDDLFTEINHVLSKFGTPSSNCSRTPTPSSQTPKATHRCSRTLSQP